MQTHNCTRPTKQLKNKKQKIKNKKKTTENVKIENAFHGPPLKHLVVIPTPTPPFLSLLPKHAHTRPGQHRLLHTPPPHFTP